MKQLKNFSHCFGCGLTPAWQCLRQAAVPPREVASAPAVHSLASLCCQCRQLCSFAVNQSRSWLWVPGQPQSLIPRLSRMGGGQSRIAPSSSASFCQLWVLMGLSPRPWVLRQEASVFTRNCCADSIDLMWGALEKQTCPNPRNPFPLVNILADWSVCLTFSFMLCICLRCVCACCSSKPLQT